MQQIIKKNAFKSKNVIDYCFYVELIQVYICFVSLTWKQKVAFSLIQHGCCISVVGPSVFFLSLCIKLYIFFSKGENSARIGDIYSCSINYYYALKPNILSSICYYSISTCDFFVNFTGQIQTHLWLCCAFQHMDIQRLLLSVYTGCSICNDNSVKETLLHLNVALHDSPLLLHTL